MFDLVAQRSCAGFLPLLRAERGPDVMPLCHIVDQHTFRGIGHLLGEDSGPSFADRFRMLFEKCTGCNPRLADLSSFETLGWKFSSAVDASVDVFFFPPLH